MRIQGIFGSLAILIACRGGTARAKDCSPLKELNSIDLVKPNPSLPPTSDATASTNATRQ